MGQAYTNKENDISENSDSCFFLQYPNNSEENNESWELGLLNTRCEYWRQWISTTTMYEWIVVDIHENTHQYKVLEESTARKKIKWKHTNLKLEKTFQMNVNNLIQIIIFRDYNILQKI